jgi:hypothetical protein
LLKIRCAAPVGEELDGKMTARPDNGQKTLEKAIASYRDPGI